MKGYSLKTKKLLATVILSGLFVGGCKNLSTSASSLNNSAANNSNVSSLPTPNKELNATSNANSKTQKKEILFDFRNEGSFPKQQKIVGAEANAVLKYVFGSNYRRAAANASVEQRMYGAFSKPNVKETLYFIRGGSDEDERGLVRFELNLLGYIVIFDKTTPVLYIKVTAYGIHKITDLNLDGKNELLLAKGGFGQGISEDGLELVQIVYSSTQTIRDFGILYEDVCGEGVAEKTHVLASAINYEPLTEEGDFPRFELSYYKRDCSKNSTWEKLAKSPFSNE